MPAEKECEQFWYFTFGGNHLHPHGYKKIWGTFGSARDEMVRVYGIKWSMQYKSPEDAGVQRFNLYEVED